MRRRSCPCVEMSLPASSSCFRSARLRRVVVMSIVLILHPPRARSPTSTVAELLDYSIHVDPHQSNEGVVDTFVEAVREMQLWCELLEGKKRTRQWGRAQPRCNNTAINAGIFDTSSKPFGGPETPSKSLPMPT